MSPAPTAEPDPLLWLAEHAMVADLPFSRSRWLPATVIFSLITLPHNHNQKHPQPPTKRNFTTKIFPFVVPRKLVFNGLEYISSYVVDISPMNLMQSATILLFTISCPQILIDLFIMF